MIVVINEHELNLLQSAFVRISVDTAIAYDMLMKLNLQNLAIMIVFKLKWLNDGAVLNTAPSFNFVLLLMIKVTN